MRRLIELNDNGCHYKAYYIGFNHRGNLVIEYLNGDRDEVSILELVTPLSEILD
jgi:hypothetical protein